MDSSRRPDYTRYHITLTSELYAIKDRVRSLVKGHWGTDGESKEVALRSILRRHLPESVIVGRGFIVSPSGCSTQVDVLVCDASKPTLFKDGDLLIVTPDAVRAVVEVKTALRSTGEFANTLSRLSAIEELCRDVTGIDSVWTGLFVYEGACDLQQAALRGIAQAFKETKRPLNCISVGTDLFVRFWNRGADVNSHEKGPVWHSYELDQVAPSYFIGNMADWISSVDHDSAGYAWFPAIGGKEAFRRWYLPMGNEEPVSFNE